MLGQWLLSGFALGCIYALIALGFVLIYKTTEVINFAQGEFLTLGAFIAFTLIAAFKISILASVFMTLCFGLGFGILLDRVIFRRLVGEEPLALIMVTIGLSIGMRSAIGMIWSYDTFSFPALFGTEPMNLGGVITTPLHVGIITITILAVLALSFFFKYTKTGISMEATAQNQLAAYLMGVNVERVFALAWGISCAIGGIAGILVAPIVFLNHNMGFIGLKAFPAAVLGGLGSIPGAIVGGLTLGLAETAAGLYMPSGVREIFPYIILFAVLMVRPEGIFGFQKQKKV